MRRNISDPNKLSEQEKEEIIPQHKKHIQMNENNSENNNNSPKGKKTQNIPTVERERMKPKETFHEDMLRCMHKSAKNHKFYGMMDTIAVLERNYCNNNDALVYGNYGGEIGKGKGVPVDCLDFILCLRDEIILENKKTAIDMSAECCRILMLHGMLQSEYAIEYANNVISFAKKGMRYGTKQKVSQTTFSQIVF